MRNLFRRSASVGFAVVLGMTCAGTSSAAADDNLAEGVPPAKIAENGLQGKLSARLVMTQGRTTAFIELASQPAVDAFNAEVSKGSGRDEAKAAAKAAKTGVGGLVGSILGGL